MARRNRLVEAHLDLVEPIARQVARRAPASIDLADLVQAGRVGLIQAAEAFERGRAPFRLFARARIRGAMLDTLRRRNWTHAQHAGLPEEVRDGAPLADELAMRAELADHVRKAVDALPRREARALAGILDGSPLQVAADAMRISQARASQLRAQGLERLRDQFPDARPARKADRKETR